MVISIREVYVLSELGIWSSWVVRKVFMRKHWRTEPRSEDEENFCGVHTVPGTKDDF